MIKAVIFDLDNTLLDFMNMKSMAVEAAVHGMIEAGLQMDREIACKKYFPYTNQRDGNIRKYLMILSKQNWINLIIKYWLLE